MFSPTPRDLESPTYNQDLIIPLNEDEEYNSNENDIRSTGNYRTSEKENVYQKTDYLPQEDEVPPLQPRNRQDSDHSHVFQNNQNNFGQMIIVRQEDNIFNQSETYHNPPQALDNYTFYDSQSPHHQENTNIPIDYNDFLQEANSMNMQNSTPIVNDTSYRGESSSSHPNQNQTVQTTQNNFGQMRTVQQVQNPSNVVNPAEMYSNNQQVMNTNVFYGAMSPPHQENRNFPILDYNDTLHGTNSMNVQNSTPVLNETSFYGESSSSHPVQNQTNQSERRGMKRPIVETLDDHNETYEYFYNITSMDTKQIVQLVNDKLLELDIHQSVFAEKVLGRTQGTASDLLKKPKAWKDLKSGRDTYRRMYMFLTLYDENMKRIEIMSRNEVQQMMNCPPIPEKEKPKNKKTTKKTTENNQSEEPQAKRSRIVFDANQINQLEGFYLQNPRPLRDTMEQIAEYMRLPYNTVYNWFMNKRRREKEEKNDTPQLTYPVYTV